jgi:hypothetical protein
MAQRPPDPFPFTVQEYHQALRLFMPDAEASVLAQGMAGFLIDVPERTGGYPASGGFISDDLLITLSLLSEELRDKVDRFRRDYDPRYGRAADQEEWEARRAELKRLIDSGELKRLLDSGELKPPE